MFHNNNLFNNHMFHNNKLFNNLMSHNNPSFNKLQFNNKFKLKFMNNQNHKLNPILKTFQFKRPILTMNKKLTTSKSHMKDNIPNKLLNKELNMSQLPEPSLNIKPLLTPVMFQFKKLTLTINKSNTLPNMFQTSDKKLKLITFLNKELNNMLTINQSKNQLLELPQPFNNQWSNNQLDNQLLLDKESNNLMPHNKSNMPHNKSNMEHHKSNMELNKFLMYHNNNKSFQAEIYNDYLIKFIIYIFSIIIHIINTLLIPI